MEDYTAEKIKNEHNYCQANKEKIEKSVIEIIIIIIIIISIKVLLEYCRNLSGGEKIKKGNYANTRKENVRLKQRKKKRLREKLSL